MCYAVGNLLKLFLFLSLCIFCITFSLVTSAPLQNVSRREIQFQEIRQQRPKRSGISDQRLAELEMLLTLKRLRDQQLRTRMPVAYGLFDPAKIGKRKKRDYRGWKESSGGDTNELINEERMRIPYLKTYLSD